MSLTTLTVAADTKTATTMSYPQITNVVVKYATVDVTVKGVNPGFYSIYRGDASPVTYFKADDNNAPAADWRTYATSNASSVFTLRNANAGDSYTICVAYASKTQFQAFPSSPAALVPAMPASELNNKTNTRYWTTFTTAIPDFQVSKSLVGSVYVKWNIDKAPSEQYALSVTTGTTTTYIDKTPSANQITAGYINTKVPLTPGLPYSIKVYQKVTTTDPASSTTLAYPTSTKIGRLDAVYCQVTESLDVKAGSVKATSAVLTATVNPGEKYRLINQTGGTPTNMTTSDGVAATVSPGPTIRDGLTTTTTTMDINVYNLRVGGNATIFKLQRYDDATVVYDVAFAAVNTPKPSLTLDSTSESTIQATWVDAYPGAVYQITYKKSGSADAPTVINNITSPTQLISGLLPEQAYDVNLFVVEQGKASAGTVPLGAARHTSMGGARSLGGSLGGGEIAGITVGGIAAVAAVVLLAVLLWRRHKSQKAGGATTLTRTW